MSTPSRPPFDGAQGKQGPPQVPSAASPQGPQRTAPPADMFGNRRTIGGLDMLVGQARQQSEWWTGVKPSAGVMRDAAERKLASAT